MSPQESLRVLHAGDVQLTYRDAGAGRAFVFQHGLGGDHHQTFTLFPRREGRQLTLNCRGHAGSQLGDPEQLSFATFALDLLGLLQSVRVTRLTLGGISMGAAVALACVGIASDLDLDGLVLVRPAWGAAPMTQPARAVYEEIARLLRQMPPAEASGRFQRSSLFSRVQQEGPAAAASLLDHFTDPRVSEMVELYERLPGQAPIEPAALRGMGLPTLIIATDDDPIHPLALAESISSDLGPRARLVEVTSKSRDPRRYQTESAKAISGFLRDNARPAR